LASPGDLVTFLEKNLPGLFQGDELAVLGTQAAIGLGLISEGRRLGGFILSRPELHPALQKVEFGDFIRVFRVLEIETLRSAERTG
jgi:hypothetical protein